MPLLRIARRTQPMRRVWWTKFEVGWAMLDSAPGQIYYQAKVDYLEAMTNM